MKPIGKVARDLGRDISKARTPTTSRAEPAQPVSAADDTSCPRCAGVGWLRRDVPVDDPDFGRVFPCSCRADEVARRRLERVAQSTSFRALERMTFGDFHVGAPGNTEPGKQSLRAAFEAARAFAKEPAGWLVLTGGYGCGKTHLAAAVVNERARQGQAALFVVVPDLLDELRSEIAAADGDLESRLKSVREVPLLVLDDLGAEAATPWAREKLFRILNHRYNAGLPTVITMNGDAEALDERLASRFRDLEVVKAVEIQALDYRGGVDPGRFELSHLMLYEDKSFQSWEHRLDELSREDATNLAKAYEAARRFAEAPEGWLVLQGPTGVGKTHLAAAVANNRAARGEAAMLVVVPDLLDHLRATFSPSSRVSYDHRFEEVRGAPLLVLDDLGTESATPWAREKLFQILNHRYVARLSTIVTTSSNLSEVPPRLRTRMLDRARCRVYALVVPPYHGGVKARPRANG